MKNLILLFALLMTSVAFGDVGPVGRSVTADNIGTVQSGAVEKWYINVKNTSGGSVADGTVFIMETTEDDGYSVTTGVAAGSEPVCILSKVDASACADDEFCRCQTWGLNSGVLFDSTNDAASAGDKAYISESTAGYVESEAFGSVAATDRPIGVFYDDASASADVQLFIKLR